MQYDKKFLQTIARQNGYNANTLEKVIRLVDVLHFLNDDALLRENLTLKGGTALNLTVFDLPRLSVDIDLDFSTNLSRSDMLECREVIKRKIIGYMTANGYDDNLICLQLVIILFRPLKFGLGGLFFLLLLYYLSPFAVPV